MPEIITIIFNCYAPSDGGFKIGDVSRIDENEKCVDAQNKLFDFLRDEHISYYYQDVTQDEIDVEQDRLESLGVKEWAM